MCNYNMDYFHWKALQPTRGKEMTTSTIIGRKKITHLSCNCAKPNVTQPTILSNSKWLWETSTVVFQTEICVKVQTCKESEDQTIKESTPTQSAKSYPHNQQIQIEKEANGYDNKCGLNNCRDSIPQPCIYKRTL